MNKRLWTCLILSLGIACLMALSLALVLTSQRREARENPPDFATALKLAAEGDKDVYKMLLGIRLNEMGDFGGEMGVTGHKAQIERERRVYSQAWRAAWFIRSYSFAYGSDTKLQWKYEKEFRYPLLAYFAYRWNPKQGKKLLWKEYYSKLVKVWPMSEKQLEAAIKKREKELGLEQKEGR